MDCAVEEPKAALTASLPGIDGSESVRSIGRAGAGLDGDSASLFLGRFLVFRFPIPCQKLCLSNLGRCHVAP